MEKTTPAVLSPDPKRWFQKKNVLIDVAVIVAVLVIVGFIWLIGHRPKSEPAPTVPQYSGQTLVDEVNKKTAQNDYSGAIKLLQGQKSIHETSTQLLLANAYANKGDTTSALKIYDELNKANKLTANSLAAAAVLSEQASDSTKALAYYKAALQKLEADQAPANNDQVLMYQAKVDELTKKAAL
jgi:tetratricopeptide (TPR) repeat protein